MPFAVVTIRSEPFYRRQAFEDGLKRLGYTIHDPRRMTGRDFFAGIEPHSRDDLLVLWNVKAGHDEQAADLFEARGGTVIVVENAYLQKVDKTIYAISAHRHNGAGWYPYDDSVDRFTPLGFPQKPWRETGKHVLIAAQRGIGSRLMASPAGWGEQLKIKTELALGEKGTPVREVRLRQHPGNHAPKVPLEQDLKNAWACVVWSSGSGVRALVEGIPVFYDAPHWICGDVAHRPGTLTKAFTTPRHSHEAVRASLNRMAWGQWNVDEISSGEPFARMRDAGWGPRPEIIPGRSGFGVDPCPRVVKC